MVAWFLHTLLITPIKWFMELFMAILSHSMNAFLAVILLSIFVNMLLSPVQRSVAGLREGIWKKSDSIRERSNHIKKTFSGVERQMVLSAYYREQNYSPLSPLLLVIPTLVQIPFFIAAWEAIANSSRFGGSSFFGLFSFYEPDALLSIGNVSVNVLPIIMTVINLIAVFLVMRGRKIFESIGSFVLPFLFLVLLYASPSGMVLYWTTSQVFSLIRTLVLPYLSKSVKHCLLLIVAAGFVLLSAFFMYGSHDVISASAYVVTVFVCMVFFVWLNWRSGEWSGPSVNEVASFAGVSIVFGLLSSVVFPLAFISGNLGDFSVSGFDYGSAILVSGVAAVGLYGLILPLLFVFCLPETRVRLTRMFFCFCVLAPICSYVLGDYQSMTQYDFSCAVDASNLSGFLIMISVYAILSVFGIACYFSKHLHKIYGWFSVAMIVVIAVYCGVCLPSVFEITAESDEMWKDHYLFSEDGEPKQFLKLSKTDKNVVVFFLDNATGHTMESMFASMPELQDKYDGFTLYSNCLSGGEHTIYGNMPLYGGYDYWFDKFLSDDGVSLADKENAAQLLMPRLFSDVGFTVSEVSPPLSGDFTWGDNFSIFDNEKNVSSYTKARLYEGLGNNFYGFSADLCLEHHIFMFGFMRALPQFSKWIVIDDGSYGDAENPYASCIPYLSDHVFLDSLSDFTDVGDNKSHLSIMRSLVTHDVCYVNYETGSLDVTGDLLFTDDLPFDHGDTPDAVGFYFSNMLYFINSFGNWLDYLRAEGVYDNTRIIIVSDHGFNEVRSQKLEGTDFYVDGFNPLLMIKDFDSQDFSISDEFMTNADTVFLAVNGIVDDPVDSFTGNLLSDERKTGTFGVTVSEHFNPNQHEENYFVVEDSELGAFSGDDITDVNSWDISGFEEAGGE